MGQEELSKNNTKLTLNVAFSYGARQEIVDAVKKIAVAVKNQEIIIDDVNENLFNCKRYKIKKGRFLFPL